METCNHFKILKTCATLQWSVRQFYAFLALHISGSKSCAVAEIHRYCSRYQLMEAQRLECATHIPLSVLCLVSSAHFYGITLRSSLAENFQSQTIVTSPIVWPIDWHLSSCKLVVWWQFNHSPLCESLLLHQRPELHLNTYFNTKCHSLIANNLLLSAGFCTTFTSVTICLQPEGIMKPQLNVKEAYKVLTSSL